MINIINLEIRKIIDKIFGDKRRKENEFNTKEAESIRAKLQVEAEGIEKKV